MCWATCSIENAEMPWMVISLICRSKENERTEAIYPDKYIKKDTLVTLVI